MCPMPAYEVKQPYVPDWRRYPVERCIMKKAKKEAFKRKCRELGMAKSKVIDELIDRLLAGKVRV